MPGIAGISHLSLSVSDAAASARWYADVLGFADRITLEGDTYVRRVCMHESGLVIGLQQHQGNDGTPFDPTRAGLDHLSFAVPDRATLEAWADHLAALGVKHSPPEDTGRGFALSFRDPDDIQLELFSPPA
ncbi:VOC family protein [Yinghuangia sp. ASG 101]|uniref:VOC family protein n=1 Tax=Yinghuangia sp. ASG 101 TaxID=2896848 RepID=UPI001E63387C|nr:VOC family protein [Yinghuangia sp. ASG 101]UGQ15145.1 VOC family protein [Yinghuangia sp. ASG 101]